MEHTLKTHHIGMYKIDLHGCFCHIYMVNILLTLLLRRFDLKYLFTYKVMLVTRSFDIYAHLYKKIMFLFNLS